MLPEPTILGMSQGYSWVSPRSYSRRHLPCQRPNIPFHCIPRCPNHRTKAHPETNPPLFMQLVAPLCVLYSPLVVALSPPLVAVATTPLEVPGDRPFVVEISRIEPGKIIRSPRVVATVRSFFFPLARTPRVSTRRRCYYSSDRTGVSLVGSLHNSRFVPTSNTQMLLLVLMVVVMVLFNVFSSPVHANKKGGGGINNCC
mmetsp:Transcript_1201/g.3041  ORF Transcript_1201/g.3041 Transcript_1201/m.3041 type:complete len:200 (-) Transcript_1201:90-689(-)